MVLRTIVGFFLVICLLFVFYIAPPWVLPIVLSVVSVLAVHEALVTTKFITRKRIIICAEVFSALVPIWVYRDESESIGLALVFTFIFGLFLIALHDHKNISFEKISVVFFSSAFIPFFLSSIIRIYNMESGRYIVVIPFLAAFITDLFAYLTGMAFGRHKLAPDISPKKTIEGLIGGLLGTMIISALYGILLVNVFNFTVNIFLLVLFGLLGGVISTFGDLFFSFIKREVGLKDFGNILPGHGGILDRFDSLLFAAPAVELMLVLFPHVLK